MTALMTILVATPCAAETLLIDFGNTNVQSGPGWNNVLPTTTTLLPLIDDTGAAFGTAQLDIIDAFYSHGEPSQLGSEMPSGDAAAFPVTATDDYLFGHTTAFGGEDPNPLSQFSISGHDPSLVYDFTFFASRQVVGDTRDALYTVRGAASTSVALNASNNDSEVALVIGVEPDARGETWSMSSPDPPMTV